LEVFADETSVGLSLLDSFSALSFSFVSSFLAILASFFTFSFFLL
jgi:hypothetical protein